MKISILIPSANGPELLLKCINSIFDNFSYENDIEIILKLDYDDKNIININHLPNREKIKIIISDKGLGYGDIHTFINEMAKLSIGDWIQILNDDAIIKTKNWDKFLEKYDFDKPLILTHLRCEGRIGANDIGDYFFPYITRKYYETVGRITGCPSYDGYLLNIAKELDITQKVPILFFHGDGVKNETENIIKNNNMIHSMSKIDRVKEKEIDKSKIKNIL